MKQENNKIENKYADVPLRVKTWLYIILVFSLGVSHTISMKFFISWIGFQVMFEFLKMFKIQANKILFSLIVGVIQFFLLEYYTIKYYYFYAFFFLMIGIIFFAIKTKKLKEIVGITTGLIITLFIFPHLFFLREGVNGLKALVFLVVVTELNDVFQYLMGKSFGKHKILPKISPNKTTEGFLGGVFLTIILSNISGYFLLPSNMFFNTVIGVIIGVLGFFGDIFMSFLKRKTNVKDTGTILPGHGGLLDRMDSLIFNAPVLFWIFSYYFQK